MRNTMPRAKSTLPATITWLTIDWKQIRRYVEKMQQRIYRAESLGNKRQVRELQRLLMRSKAALLLSIKRITQANKGKKTAGIDGLTILTDVERIKLYQKMKSLDIGRHKAKPTRRVYIKKKNGNLRPLSIPVIIDRVWQNVLKLSLEPQWEFRFESTSYGFRPGRSTHDAIERIYKSLVHGKRQWVFEGDFRGCFDNLNHEYIMEQIRSFPNKQIIADWMKTGYVDNQVYHITEAGSGQGAVISPLIANIALHGMEEELGIQYKEYIRSNGSLGGKNVTTMTMVRYADDFVIICRTEKEANSIYEKLNPYLIKRGLELEPEKTKVVKVTEGFDFLGFNVRRYIGKQGEKLLIKPSNESMKKCRQKISEKVSQLHGENAGILIRNLNPIIRGTANYWLPEVSSKAFSDMDYHIFQSTYRFLIRMHKNKSKSWINTRYFRPDYNGKSKNKWILTDPKEVSLQLLKMSSFHIKRHRLIRYKASLYDSDLKEYFKQRNTTQPINKTLGERRA